MLCLWGKGTAEAASPIQQLSSLAGLSPAPSQAKQHAVPSPWAGHQSLQPGVSYCVICLSLSQELTGSQPGRVAPCG